jgi:hypothetical protein
MRPVTGAARRSLWGRATVALVALIQVAIVVLAIELTVSVGYESPQDHVHAPVPALGW